MSGQKKIPSGDTKPVHEDEPQETDLLPTECAVYHLRQRYRLVFKVKKTSKEGKINKYDRPPTKKEWTRNYLHKALENTVIFYY